MHTEQPLGLLHRRLGARPGPIAEAGADDSDEADEVIDVTRESGARLFSVGVFCSLQELEHRESSRGDGNVEGRPLGLARRSDEICHSHGLDYDVTVRTDEQSTAESVDTIIAALRAAGYLRGDSG
jgi:chloramphenicol 3-O-phosphotransferase